MKRLRSAFVLTGLMGLLSIGLSISPPATRAASEPSVLEIFRKTLRAYADCRSYQDQGIAETSFDSLTELGPSKARFTTNFRRGASLRFEYNPGEWDHFVLWTDGRAAKTLFAPGGGKTTDYNDAGDALASAGMASDDVGSLVASLVFAKQFQDERATFKVFDIGLHGLSDLRRIGDAAIAGEACYRIAAKGGENDRVYWIDQRTHLIRRVEETAQSPLLEGTRRRVVTFQPRTGANVPDAALKFD